MFKNSSYEASITQIPKRNKDATHIKRKLQANITDKHRCKNLQQIIAKQIQQNSKRIIYQDRPKPSQRKRNARRQSGCLRRLYKQWRKERSKGKGERKRNPQLNAEFQRISRRYRKAFFYEKSEENNGMGKTRDFFKKTGDIKGTFHARMGTIKDINGKDLTETEEIN